MLQEGPGEEEEETDGGDDDDEARDEDEVEGGLGAVFSFFFQLCRY